MAATTLPSERLDRFDRVERAVHWANAALFLVLLATAAVLYVAPLSALVSRRALVKDIHVYAGLALPLPVVLGLAGSWRRRFAEDVSRFNRWDDDDRRWLLSRGADPGARMGKFNAGQKVNAAFTAGAIVVMLATGSIMKWFGPFPDSWRTGATFVHDCLFLALVVVITGHIAFALADREALNAMVRGWISPEWARRRAPKWYDEVTQKGEELHP